MNVLWVVLIYGCVLAANFPVLRKAASAKFRCFYAACFAISLAVMVLYSLGIDLPGPTRWIHSLVHALS